MFATDFRGHLWALTVGLLVMLGIVCAVWPGATAYGQDDELPVPAPLPAVDIGEGPGFIGNTARPGKLLPEHATGGHIQMLMPGSFTVTQRAWTVVQWQDSAGAWHDVEGWRQVVEETAVVRWWVAPKDAGTGPFRWVAYAAGAEREIVGTSAAFSLPGRGEVVTVNLLLLPHAYME
jgi:hypothetical protein